MNNRFEYQSRLKPEFIALDNAIMAGDLPAFQRAMQERKDWGYQTTIATSGETLLDAAISHGKSTIVNSLLETELKMEYFTETLSKVINFYINKNHPEEQYKIALNLICCGVELPDELVQRLDKKDKLFDFIDLMKKCKDCPDNRQRSSLENSIGVTLKQAGLQKKAIEYYHLAINSGNSTGMYNLACLLRDNKNYLEASHYLLECASHFKGQQKDQDDIIEIFRTMITNSKDEHEQEQLLSALSEVYKLFNETDKLKMVQVRLANYKAGNEASQLMSAQAQLTAAHILSAEDKEQKGVSGLLDNNYFYNRICIRAKAANLGCEDAYNELVEHAIKDNTTILETQIMSCHFVLSSPFASQRVKSECQKKLDKYSLLYQGLCHLFGLGMSVHIAKSIRLFEQFITSHDQQDKEAIETATIYKIQAEVYRIINEPSSEKRLQFFTQIMDQLKRMPYAVTSTGEACLFKCLFALMIKVNEESQVKLLDLIMERYQASIYKWNASDFHESLLNKILSFKLVEKNESLLKKLIGIFIKAHNEKSKNLKPFAISQLQIMEKYSNDPKFQFKVKLALAECYASYSDAVNLEQAIKYYEALLPLQAAARENVRIAALRDVYKRYGDCIKDSNRQGALAAYHKAARLGDVAVLKSMAADEKSIPDVIEYFKTAFSKATKKNIHDIVKHFFSVTEECALLESDYLQELVLSVYRNFGDVLSFSELEKAHLPFSAAKVKNDLQIANLFANKSIAKTIKAGVDYFLEQKDQSNQEAIFYHFKKCLISSLSKKFDISDFGPLFLKNPKLASLQNNLFPFLKENILMFVGSLDKDDSRYEKNLYLLYQLLSYICKDQELTNVDNEMKLVDVTKMLLDLDSIEESDEDILLDNLHRFMCRTQQSNIQERAMAILMENRPGFLKEEKNQQVLMLGLKFNHTDAVYRLSKLYETEKKDLDATLYLKTKFIILSFKDKSYSKSAQNALRFLNVIAKSHNHDLAIVANFYLQVINDLRAFKLDKNSDIDAILLNAIETLDLSQVKSKITKGMQSFAPVALVNNAMEMVKQKVTSQIRHVDIAAHPVACHAPEVKVNAPLYPSMKGVIVIAPQETLPSAPSFEVVQEPVLNEGGPLVGQGTRFIPVEIKEEVVVNAPSRKLASAASASSQSAEEWLEEALKQLPAPPVSSLRRHSLLKPQPERLKEGQENLSQEELQPGQVVLAS